MQRSSVHYAVLRDHQVWDGVTLAGLQADPDGVHTLARLPGAADQKAIILPAPYDVALSGMAVRDGDDIYLAETSRHSILWIMGGCRDNKATLGTGAGGITGQFNSPRGMLIGGGGLYLADSGNGRVLVFRLPTLELRAVWDGVLQEPTSLASDSQGRIYVLDGGLKRVLRFDPAGAPDAAYNNAMSQSQLTSPFALAIGSQDVLYVAEETNVLRFDRNGQAVSALSQAGGPTTPRALVARGDRLYAADAGSGRIHLHLTGEDWLGVVPDYRGPVAAMALDSAGRLYIKPGLDAAYYLLEADAAYVSSGMLTAGPFDAGLDAEWERAHAEVDRLTDTDTELRVYPSASATPPPSETDWGSAATLAPGLDALVPPLPGQAVSPAAKRFIWLRVVLRTSNPHQSPRLLQVEAATPSESYIEFLPAIYSRADTQSRFLERWLALFQGDFNDWERRLDVMPRRFDPVTAPEGTLPWLANWLAFQLPPGKHATEWRRLLGEASRLYQRRGTSFGIREFCEIYAGVRPQILEAFHQRHVWQLGHTSSLGFDTVLAAASPEGMVVSGFTYADPAFSGLRGDYYGGTNFEQLKLTRTDPTIDFDWKDLSPDPDVLPPDAFSARWTGQLRPRYSELYTFHTRSDDGVRLFIDGRLIIDNWTDHPPTEDRGTIALASDRWYPITLEYYEKGGVATISLAWSSRSQLKEVVPQRRLYAIVDEGARLAEGSGEGLLVGQAVVGASGPLQRSEFGTPLFEDTAYLFSVLLPAARLPSLAQREQLRRVLEAEKPAHTDFHLCFIDASMRVGFQARVGIDSIVAGPPAPMSLSGAVLGHDSYLGDDDETDGAPTGRVGKHAHVGHDAIVG